MDKKILIAYAGKYGSTGEIAHSLAEVICNLGAHVDVKSIEEVESFEGYDGIILGSAIRFGGWLKDAYGFVKRNSTEINRLPLAMFSVHILNLDETAGSRKARETYTAPVRAIIKPLSEAFFAGVLEPEDLSLPDKMITRIVKSETGDLRDWDQIHEWGESVFTLLTR